jgi:2-hydroxychromene-2-carboxylate isomerase
MTPTLPIVDFYFDFISPFAYLQSERLAELEAHATVRRVPVLFAGLLNHWGHKGPAEIPTKRRFVYRFCVWRAAQMGVAFMPPPAHPFNPLKLLRLAVALDARPDVVQRLFRFVWADGRSSDDAASWLGLCAEFGLTPDDPRLASHDVKTRLKQSTDDAIAAGVFGVPTLRMPDGELYWGEDAMPMVVDHLRGAEVMSCRAMGLAGSIPEAVQRRIRERTV